MNPLQKAATLIVRLLGSAMVVVAVSGMLYLGFMAATGQDLSAFPGTRRVGSVVWGAAGCILIAGAKRIGYLMGHGLD